MLVAAVVVVVLVGATEQQVCSIDRDFSLDSLNIICALLHVKKLC